MKYVCILTLLLLKINFIYSQENIHRFIEKTKKNIEQNISQIKTVYTKDPKKINWTNQKIINKFKLDRFIKKKNNPSKDEQQAIELIKAYSDLLDYLEHDKSITEQTAEKALITIQSYDNDKNYSKSSLNLIKLPQINFNLLQQYITMKNKNNPECNAIQELKSQQIQTLTLVSKEINNKENSFGKFDKILDSHNNNIATSIQTISKVEENLQTITYHNKCKDSLSDIDLNLLDNIKNNSREMKENLEEYKNFITNKEEFNINNFMNKTNQFYHDHKILFEDYSNVSQYSLFYKNKLEDIIVKSKKSKRYNNACKKALQEVYDEYNKFTVQALTRFNMIYKDEFKKEIESNNENNSKDQSNSLDILNWTQNTLNKINNEEILSPLYSMITKNKEHLSYDDYYSFFDQLFDKHLEENNKNKDINKMNELKKDFYNDDFFKNLTHATNEIKNLFKNDEKMNTKILAFQHYFEEKRKLAPNLKK